MANLSVYSFIVIAFHIWSATYGLQVLGADGQFRYDYKYFPEARGWIKLHKVPATWYEARLKCYYEGAVLMSPTNERLYGVMRSLMLSRGNVSFSGVQSLTSAGDYFSVEGVHLLEMPIRWAKGEPDNRNDEERCLAMLADGSMADVKCGDVRIYMCYKEKTADLTITECYTSDKEYVKDPRTGSCYKFHPDCVTWWRAHMVCSSEGGHLVIVNSEVEADLLHERFANRPIKCNEQRFIHVGFNNPYAERPSRPDRAYWFTVDGKRLEDAGYARWADNEPNNVAGIENCGALTRNNIGLNDWKCDDGLPFVCEIPSPRIPVEES